MDNKDEVVEAMSPGDHVNKRRARSRPVSAELLSSVASTPAPNSSQVCDLNLLSNAEYLLTRPVAYFRMRAYTVIQRQEELQHSGFSILLRSASSPNVNVFK